MPPVLVEIQPRPADADEDEIEFVEDLDQIVETTMCSCNAGDDNPYSAPVEVAGPLLRIDAGNP